MSPYKAKLTPKRQYPANKVGSLKMRGRKQIDQANAPPTVR